MTLPGPGEWPVTDPVEGPVGDLLRERAQATPDATALVDVVSGDEYSYAAFDDRVGARAASLDRYDPEGGRVGLLLGTRPAVAELYFAAVRRGAAVVPLNVELPAERLRSQVRRADLDCLVCEADTEGLAVDIAGGAVSVASVDEPDREAVDSLAPRTEASARTSERALDDERVVVFTSGTTGDPKGVRLTAGNLVASAVGSAERLGVAPGDRWLVCLPMYHTGGLAPLVRSTLYGTTTVLQRSFDAAATARVSADHAVTGVSLVPTMLRRLLGAGWDPDDRLRFVLLGGAPASRDLLEAAADRGVPVYPTYGTTETASQVATATPSEAVDYPGTVGRPLAGTDVTVTDPDGSADASDGDGAPPAGLPAGERGELVVSGPTVSPGYLDDGQTAAAFGPEGFHTGDLGYRDEAGRLWVVGRVDDRIVTGGENVHPARVADALREHDAVADAAVVGLPDEEWGERVAALVVADSVSAAVLRAAARDRLADFAVPKTLAFADALPRTASGTVDRDAVRERLEAARE